MRLSEDRGRNAPKLKDQQAFPRKSPIRLAPMALQALAQRHVIRLRKERGKYKPIFVKSGMDIGNAASSSIKSPLINHQLRGSVNFEVSCIYKAFKASNLITAVSTQAAFAFTLVPSGLSGNFLIT